MSDLTAELAQVRLFVGLDEAALAGIARHAHVRTLARGQVLFTEGEPSEHVFVVRSGRLRVFVTSRRGDQLVLSVLGPGDSFGELSVLDRQPRSASVDALDTAQILALAAADVRTLLTENSQALMAVAVELAAGMRRLTGNAADLVLLDLPRRLAKMLLASAEPLTDGGATSMLSMNQSGVAAQLGVTRQSFNRALAGLTHRGWIALDGTRVHIRDVAALRRFADS